MDIMPTNMRGSIIMYRFPRKTPNKIVNQFCKKFYGQDTSSHRGKYRYHRHGLLDDLPHRRLTRQVVIVRSQDASTVIGFLEKYSLEIHVRQVELTDEDCSVLGIDIE